jgi:hypothetical protein
MLLTACGLQCESSFLNGAIAPSGIGIYFEHARLQASRRGTRDINPRGLPPTGAWHREEFSG